jgi:6-pyruvoyl-tetrahydropterin synthase
MIEVARRYFFVATHSLPGVEGYDEEHGHRYTIEVVARGSSLDGEGMVIDTAALDRIFEPMVKGWSGSNLNDYFAPSTVEVIADELLGEVDHLPNAYAVTVWEDDERWGRASR